MQDFYLVSLDVRPESDVESVTCLEHLKAIPLDYGLIEDCRGRRDMSHILADECFTKGSVRWQRKKSFRIGFHL